MTNRTAAATAAATRRTAAATATRRPTAARRPVVALLAASLLLTVLAVPAAGVDAETTPALEPAPAHLPQTPRVDITPQEVDLTFPVAADASTARFSDDFLALRGGGSRLHAATDIMAPKHTPVVAAVGGIVTSIPFEPGRDGWSALGEPSYGWMVSIRGDDGRRYAYVHMNNDTRAKDAGGRWLDDDAGGIAAAFSPRIVAALQAKGSSLRERDGFRVERGELLGWLGDSGNAKGVVSHLHFEIHMTDAAGEYRINPYHSLVAARSRGDVIDPSKLASPTKVAPPGAGGYLDVDPKGTHTGAIVRLTEAGIIRGCDADLFCPHAPITRDDIAAAIAAALQLDTTVALASRAGTGYLDVPVTHRDAGAIAAVGEAGVLAGYGDGRFGPDEALSRAQLATALTQAFGLPDAPWPAPFTDVGPTAVHGRTIAAAYAAGLTKGCGDGTRYCSFDDVTRGQFATFLEQGLATGR